MAFGQEASPEQIAELSGQMAVKVYPDTANANSPMVKRMFNVDEYLRENDLELFYNPNKPLLLSTLMADELRIKPKLSGVNAKELQFVNQTMSSARSLRNFYLTTKAKPPEPSKAEPTPEPGPPPGMVRNPNRNDIFDKSIPASKALASYAEPEYVTPAEAAQINANRAEQARAEADKARELAAEQRHLETIQAIKNNPPVIYQNDR